jgi:predicted DNA-binding transcriptional regulator YafY
MPPPSEAALRYAIIDRCLTNPYRPYPTMKILKQEIERELKTSVSSETIQKDIAHMKKPEKDGGYGAPIKFNRSVNGYFYNFEEFPDFTIRSLGLNDKEVEAIELAAGILKQFKGIKVNDSYNNAIDKLFSSVNIKKSEKEKNLTVAIQPEETTYMRGMEYFETFVSSIKKKIPVSFIHYSYGNKTFKSIIVHPYLMKESNKRWYVVGYSESVEHKESPLRYFGLDRIYDPVLINKEFIPNQGDDIVFLFENKIGLHVISKNREVKPEEIILWVSKNMANYIKSMPLHKSQTIEEAGGDGEIYVKLNLVPTLELIALILSYGEHMELIKPKWLRTKISEELQHSLFKYSN